MAITREREGASGGERGGERENESVCSLQRKRKSEAEALERAQGRKAAAVAVVTTRFELEIVSPNPPIDLAGSVAASLYLSISTTWSRGDDDGGGGGSPRWFRGFRGFRGSRQALPLFEVGDWREIVGFLAQPQPRIKVAVRARGVLARLSGAPAILSIYPPQPSISLHIGDSCVACVGSCGQLGSPMLLLVLVSLLCALFGDRGYPSRRN